MQYALKLQRAGDRPQWRTGLSLSEALAMAGGTVQAEETALSPRYLTATIYRDAMVVHLCRYFPPEMRTKTGSPPPTARE
ncbi:MAG: hypothetical protein KIT83_02245 [Bryobacterales bacterium]|nr:hypothetical protein [Bryobacterales bacterium]